MSSNSVNDRMTLIGIDPGLVHTGLVILQFDAALCRLSTRWFVIDGPDAAKTRHIVEGVGFTPNQRIFIEGYRPRLHYGTDARMLDAVKEFKAKLPTAHVLDNMGIKSVVTDDLLKLMELWNFFQVTHHQDLRSAARIALFGALKEPLLNSILTRYVQDAVDGHRWEHHY